MLVNPLFTHCPGSYTFLTRKIILKLPIHLGFLFCFFSSPSPFVKSTFFTQTANTLLSGQSLNRKAETKNKVRRGQGGVWSQWPCPSLLQALLCAQHPQRVVKGGSRGETPYAKGSSSSGPWDLYSDPVTSNQAGRGHLCPEDTSVLLLAGFSAFLTDHAQPNVQTFLNRSLS